MASTPKSNHATQYTVWGVALVLIVLAAFAIRSLTRERVSVVVAEVSYQDVAKPFQSAGKVEPESDFQVHAPAAGQVQNVYVDVGDKVKPGQLLLKMDDKPALSSVAHAQSMLQAAQLASSNLQQGGSLDERNSFAADLSKARLQRQQDGSDLAARQKLLAQGAASAAEVAEAKHRVQVDDDSIASIEQHSTHRYQPADIARAAAELADAKASVAAAQSGYATAAIRSPIAGTVYYLPVAQYDYVDAGESLISVADLTRLRVTAYFDEPDIANLAAGQPVTIQWEAKPGMTWHGHILQAPTTVQNYQQRFVGECLITVDDANGVLEPNASVKVTVTTAVHSHVLEIPHEALQHDASGFFVWKIANNRLVRSPVEPGIINLKQVEIISGLAIGDTVVLNATTNVDLTKGLEVIPFR